MWKKLRGRRRSWLVVPLALAVAGGTGVWLMTRDSSAATEPTTYTVSASTMKETVTASGTIEPRHSADLDFEVSGTVTDVYVDEGDRVTQGQALARVDDDALVATRTAAAASLAAAYSQLDDDQDADASDTQLAADQAAIVAARATLAEAKQAVADATLRATITGTVASLDLAVGDVVTGGGSGGTDPTASGSATTSAVVLVSSGHYVVDATVASSDVKQLKKGLQAEITPTGVTETVYGTVKSVGLVAETSSSGAAVFPVTIEVTGKRKDLYAGTSADASIIVEQRDDVLTVPSRALETDDDGDTYVTKVVDGKSVKTPVEVGTAYGMSTEITSGLEDGDVVEIPSFTPTGGGSDGGSLQDRMGEGGLPDFSQMPGGGQQQGPIVIGPGQ
ncbi:efflux RND transporter periplasmic adaptor subunit [Nocardioides sp.]|uniref:efflux RND transporter periplasmic adaptor subunit n=1 Tax=Nocardioides sp. TaxID=35761 RepID=UPI002EDB2E3C